MVNRALYAVLALAAILATLLLLQWPSGPQAPSSSASPARGAIDEPPKPDAPRLPSTAPETSVARQEVEIPGTPIESAPAPSEATGRVVLHGVVAIWGEAKPYPPLRVRATDVETGEGLLEGDSSADGNYVLSGEFPVARAPFEVNLEAEGEGLIQAIWSRAGIEVGKVPFDGQVFPLFLHRPMEVRGRVLELLSGAPIAGALVCQAWKDDQIRFGPRARFLRGIPNLSRATTDAEGEFRVLVPAALRKRQVLVEADGFMPGSASWEGAPPGDPVEVRLARVDESPRIRGQVSWADGRPAAGVKVKAQVLGNRDLPPGALSGALTRYSEFLQATQPDVPTTTTDGEGGFLVPVPFLGNRKLSARLGEGGLAEAEVWVREALEYPCEIRPAEDAVVVVGTVRAKRSGLPIAGATVHADLSSLGEIDDSRFRQAILRTEEKGVFRLGPVPRQPYALHVRARGFAPASSQATPDPGGQELRISVELDEDCRLRGTAVDEEGRPVGGATVIGAWPKGPVYTRADGRGSFEIGSLPAEVDILFSARAFRNPGDGGRRTELRSDPLPPVRFSAPGEVRDLGHVVLRLK